MPFIQHGAMQGFELNKKYLAELREVIHSGDEVSLLEFIDNLHPADVAEILDQLSVEEGKPILNSLDAQRASEALMELDDELRRDYLDLLTSKEIAQQFVENLDSDDAADLVQELDEEKRKEVIREIEDVEVAEDLVDLLSYPEGTAGALMGKEYVWVNTNWSVAESVRQMRRQAEQMEQVYTVYVVDAHDKLLGRLPLKRLLTSSIKAKIQDVYSEKVRYVLATAPQEEVAQTMEKYDLVVIPVVDELNRLIGRITIDDVVDVIREEADKDYQLASGITEDVEITDSIWELTRARLPWLIIGLFGGMLNATIIGGYENAIATIPALAFFMPLITATAGNVGVQSSAIIVQGLANNSLSFNSVWSKIWKELSVALLNGAVISILAFALCHFMFGDDELGITVSISLMSVILLASLMGTIVPLGLDKYKIDPALATGPFITTSNDIIGLFVYFTVGQLIYGGLL